MVFIHKKAARIAGISMALALVSSTALADSTVSLRILETTDIHTHLVNYDYYRDGESDTVGLAKVATLLKTARGEAENVVFIDNGDLIQGNPLGDYMAKERGLKDGDVHPVYKAMNLLGYDAANIGNHEFNYGLDFLGKSLAGANFPYVSANVFVDDGDDNPDNDKPYFEPYVLLDREFTDNDGKVHKAKVGVIGFVPPQIMQWDKANLEGNVIAKDIVEMAKKYVPEMREKGADIVIAVPHSGLSTMARNGMEENATYYLSEVDGIDAILFGHAHTVFPSETFSDLEGVDIAKGTINGVAAVMPGFWGSHLGVIDLTLNVTDDGKWSVTDSLSDARPIYQREGRTVTPLVEADPEIIAAVKEEHEATIAYMREGVGTTSAPINSFFALVADDPSIQIVTNAQKWYLEKILNGSEYDGIPILSAGAPFKAGGRGGPDYFTDIPEGKIALKNVADLYIYPNTVRAVLLDGDQVREWLEMSAGQFNQIDPNSSEEQALINPDFPTYNYDVIDGVTYQIDVTKPARYNKAGEVINPDSHRIVNLSFEGKPVTADQKFVVATNNYRAGGGGNFPGLDGSTIIVEAPDENRTVLANYILTEKEIDPKADGNWTFAPIGEASDVTFVTSPKASSAVNAPDNISFVGEDQEGFAKYVLQTR
ncbi:MULTISPECIES: bifunctional 2',3'-cyclic-nucleotide 2'-phosphodiesterase/3'-nucleotidase [unclassified Thalassospira]|uniref:bifunctional 2',3'-cyclic-nucleotide 2'-phosphodiesterase/3'-nucleotidase n=1 Tax=unclassified Thalassospira TaxID=2648997 RepID=UPI0007A59124|nr:MULTISPECIES: bifunctional 2',3'-cyclic-nucleotide 2'-phosphodiesterase/3'-nucleotidase [unclassified Thalassospira]KZC99026.1 2',3'-cyclic-nucleotide 2'-phosphodiesterase [Thalassospira sp. MCCC 1A02898]ONH88679.1 2', 3'-cyclic nucleotide 2'-phosphodiesterase [Thalassospira sp. MCCC 1A02803]